MIAAIVVPCGRLNSATTLACLEPARERGDLSRPLFRGLAGAVVALRRLTKGDNSIEDECVNADRNPHFTESARDSG
jgi:hypothetical protein